MDVAPPPTDGLLAQSLDDQNPTRPTNDHGRRDCPPLGIGSPCRCDQGGGPASISRLTFLIDTNVLIVLEPDAALRPSENWESASRFQRSATQHGHGIYVHPASRVDLAKCSDPHRRAIRLSAYQRYPELPGFPQPPSTATNDELDELILDALAADAATYLVSDDVGVRRRARSRSPDLEARVLTLDAALDHLAELHPSLGVPRPRITACVCHQIPKDDPILASIREDYKGFDKWFARCCQQQRGALVIRDGDSGPIDGICIWKEERDTEHDLPTPRLKLCTLKVAESARRQRFGELLIKAATDIALDLRLVGLYVTAFAKHEALIALLTDLGFQKTDARTPEGELVLFRDLVPQTNAVGLDGFEYHRRFGPRAVRVGQPTWIVPIQPRYARALLPETQSQIALFPEHRAAGNAIRKAYLSQVGKRRVAKGDALLFYQSEDPQEVRSLGVCERVAVTCEPSMIARLVRGRTVYTEEEIQQLTKNGTADVLVILFWEARSISPALKLGELISAGVVKKAPQAVQQVRQEGITWLRARLDE